MARIFLEGSGLLLIFMNFGFRGEYGRYSNENKKIINRSVNYIWQRKLDTCRQKRCIYTDLTNASRNTLCFGAPIITGIAVLLHTTNAHHPHAHTQSHPAPHTHTPACCAWRQWTMSTRAQCLLRPPLWPCGVGTQWQQQWWAAVCQRAVVYKLMLNKPAKHCSELNDNY
jgi:hypothetical protein